MRLDTGSVEESPHLEPLSGRNTDRLKAKSLALRYSATRLLVCGRQIQGA